MINLIKNLQPKDDDMTHIGLNDIFTENLDDYNIIKPIFSEKDLIGKQDTTLESYDLKNSLYYIKNFCSTYLSFKQNLDDIKKIDKEQNYSKRFTTPLNEIKYDYNEARYIAVQNFLLKTYKHVDVTFKVFVVETNSYLTIVDKLVLTNDKYYIQPEIEYIVYRLMYNNIIPQRDVLIIEELFAIYNELYDTCKTCSIYKQKSNSIKSLFDISFKYKDDDIVLKLNDYNFCHHCRFHNICLKERH